MPRTRRNDAPGARHHVMNRGARRAPIFLIDAHCAEFLSLIAQLPHRFGLAVHGYALMPNHFHLMLESRRGELSGGMAFLQGRYTRFLNRERGWDGPLFRARFRNKRVVRPDHWQYLLAYLHLNPVQARLVMKPSQASWTSHQAYAGQARQLDWLTTEELLSALGGRAGYLAYLQSCMRRKGMAPEDFEREVLFGVGRLGEPVAGAGSPEPEDPAVAASLDKALVLASRRLKAERGKLVIARSGRAADPRRQATVWWLVQRQGIRVGDVAKALGISRGRVSQLVNRAERRSPGSQLDLAVQALCGASSKGKP